MEDGTVKAFGGSNACVLGLGLKDGFVSTPETINGLVGVRSCSTSERHTVGVL
jgi:hypothetical protein